MSLCTKALAVQNIISYEKELGINPSASALASEKKAEDWFYWNFSSNSVQRGFDAYVNLSSRFYYGTNGYIFSVSQAYLSEKFNNTSIYFGRKLLEWDPNEHFWEFDKVNGRRGFSLVEKDREGLVGLYVDHKINKSLELSLYGSYFFIPSLNPNYKVKDGKMTTSSNWVSPPPTRYNVEGKSLPIHYNEIDEPPLKEILLNKSLGIKLKYLWKNGMVTGYGLYKPENNLRVNIDGYINKESEKVLVDIKPYVNHHFIYGLETAHKFGDLNVSSGLNVVDPSARINMDLWPGKITFQNLNRDNHKSEHIRLATTFKKQNYFHTQIRLTKPSFDMKLAYIYLLNDIKEGGESFYGDAVKWINAAGVALNYRVTDRFKMLFDFKYDFFNKDNVLVNEVTYTFLGRLMSLALGMELLKSRRPSSFWYWYRANDTIYSNFSYNF